MEPTWNIANLGHNQLSIQQDRREMQRLSGREAQSAWIFTVQRLIGDLAIKVFNLD